MPVYSHSRISTFENCPLQYKYRYIDRIRTGIQSIEAFMGKCAHEVLEEVYRDLPRARRDGLEPYVEMFGRIWDRKLDPSIRVVRPDLDAAYYRRLGAQCVRNYWERNEPFPIRPEQIIGLEMKVELTLDTRGRYRMMGFVDRVQHGDPGVIEIHDYKTSASLPRPGSLRFDRQLPLYEMAIRARFPETREVRLIWHYVAHATEFVETRTEGELERIRTTCVDKIRKIEVAQSFPPRKSALCAWCEYSEICPEWEGAKPTAAPAFPSGRPDQPPPAKPEPAGTPEREAARESQSESVPEAMEAERKRETPARSRPRRKSTPAEQLRLF